MRIPPLSEFMQTGRGGDASPDWLALLLIVGILVALGYWFLHRGSS